jgi:hypothetical protein
VDGLPPVATFFSPGFVFQRLLVMAEASRFFIDCLRLWLVCR